MQKKYTILFLIFSISLMIGYFWFLRWGNLGEWVQINPIINPPSLSGEKKIQTHMSSWVISSGMIFRQPNTEWKTRTLSGINYVFWEGNPKGVELTGSDYELKSIETCKKPSLDSLSYSEFCNPENETLKYITPQIEKYILNAMSDPNWMILATTCESNLRFMETIQKTQNILTFNQVFQTQFLQMENFLSIDPKTGWKKLDDYKLSLLVQFIEQGRYEYGRGDITQNPYGDCVDRYGSDLLKNLIRAKILYQNPSLTSEVFTTPVYTTYWQPIKENIMTWIQP